MKTIKRIYGVLKMLRVCAKSLWANSSSGPIEFIYLASTATAKDEGGKGVGMAFGAAVYGNLYNEMAAAHFVHQSNEHLKNEILRGKEVGEGIKSALDGLIETLKRMHGQIEEKKKEMPEA